MLLKAHRSRGPTRALNTGLRRLLGNVALSALTISMAAALLWQLSGIAPLLTLTGGFLWASIAHAITLDEERPGGIRNEEGSRAVWLASRLELAIKLALLASISVVLMLRPEWFF